MGFASIGFGVAYFFVAILPGLINGNKKAVNHDKRE
jgi:hypothetical protein